MGMLFKNLAYSMIAILKMHKAFHGCKHRDCVLKSEIIRNVHSIEKGMCIDSPRMEYGKGKIKNLFDLMTEYCLNWGGTESDELKMGIAAIESYLQFHKARGYNTDYLNSLEERLNEFVEKNCLEKPDCRFGGSLQINNKPYDHEAINAFCQFIENRHSTRDFAQTEVDNETIKKAIELANRCPSACNRQTTRVYILEKNKISELKQWLSGIGGFADSLNKLLVITGQISAFNDGEVFQHIMNAGIFTGYLSMALEIYGLGACVIQRPLLFSRQWAQFAKENDIPTNEQITCVIAVGNKKDHYKTPVSYRFSAEKLTTVIK